MDENQNEKIRAMSDEELKKMILPPQPIDLTKATRVCVTLPGEKLPRWMRGSDLAELMKCPVPEKPEQQET